MSSSGSRRERRKYWKELCAEFERDASGLTQFEFASKHGVNPNRFRKWLYKLRREDASPSVPVQSLARFVEVKMPSGPLVAGPLVRVRVGTGVEVDFNVVPPPAWVAELVTRLGSSTC